MKKRILASLMALCLIVGLLPATAMAAEEENSGELSVLADESLPLTGYCGADTSSPYSTIYKYLDSEGVEQVATYYSNATWKLESIGILSVTTSNGTANETAYRLTISGTGQMGDFPGSWGQGKPWFDIIASNLNLAPAGGSRLCIKELVIENGITKLGAHAFEAYQNITSISMPNSVIKIGENAFNHCDGVTSITFSSRLKEIGKTAFSDCDALTSILLPDSLETIGSSAFSGCDSLSGALNIPNNVKTIGSGAFSNDTKLNGKLTLGSSVTSIGKSAFSSCRFNDTLTIPDSVTSIGEGAFNACKFTNLSLGNGLVEIGRNAFYNSGTYSGHLSIPDSVTTIGESAFSSLGFASIHLGKSVTTIGASAFINCTSVHSLDVTSVGSTVSYNTQAFKSMANPNTIYLNSDEQKKTISNYISENRSAFAITNGGTFAADTEFKSGELAAPIKEGSIFSGWYDNNECTGTAVTTHASGKTYYAKWTEKEDAQSISYENTTVEKHINGGTFTNELTKTTVNGEITYTSSNTDAATVNETTGKVTIVGAGTTTITATAAETDAHKKAVAAYTLTVTDHSYTNYVSNNDATCTEDGTKTAKCDFCDAEDTLTDIGTKTGHDWAETTYAWSEDGKSCTATHVCLNDDSHTETAQATITSEQTKAPSCTGMGETTYTATFDADWVSQQTKTIVDVPAAGHSYVKHNAVPATHESDGTAEHYTCENCDLLFDTEKQETTQEALVIAKLGHDFSDEWKSDETNHWHECECGEKSSELAHTFEWVTDKEATETEKGSKHEECSVCGYKKAAVEIPATGSPEQPGDNTPGGDNENPSKPDTDAPQTGDNSNMLLWFALLAVSAAGVGSALLISKKRGAHAKTR